VLRPHYAVLWAHSSISSLPGVRLNVANTIAPHHRASVIDAQVIFAALIGAIVWNLITWDWGYRPPVHTL